MKHLCLVKQRPALLNLTMYDKTHCCDVKMTLDVMAKKIVFKKKVILRQNQSICHKSLDPKGNYVNVLLMDGSSDLLITSDRSSCRIHS